MTEFALTPAEVGAALRCAAMSRFRDTPGERDLHVMKAFRAKFGMDFVEWRTKAKEIEYDATPEGGFVMRDKPIEGDAPAATKAKKPRKDKGVKRGPRKAKAVQQPAAVAA